jgi:hypothetical protein
LLQEGAENVIITRKKRYHRCFIAVKVGVLGDGKQEKAIK